MSTILNTLKIGLIASDWERCTDFSTFGSFGSIRSPYYETVRLWIWKKFARKVRTRHRARHGTYAFSLWRYQKYV